MVFPQKSSISSVKIHCFLLPHWEIQNLWKHILFSKFNCWTQDVTYCTSKDHSLLPGGFKFQYCIYVSCMLDHNCLQSCDDINSCWYVHILNTDFRWAQITFRPSADESENLLSVKLGTYIILQWGSNITVKHLKQNTFWLEWVFSRLSVILPVITFTCHEL